MTNPHLDAGLAIINGPPLETEVWHHLAFTCDGKELKAYLDGEMYSSVGAGGDIAKNTNDIRIGGRPEPSLPFNGIIDEVAVWNIARTDEEIIEDMAGVQIGAAVDASGKLTTTWAVIKVR